MAQKRLPGFSLRQTQVALLTAQGHSVPSIARTLGISIPVASYHRGRAYRKLGVNSVAHLARWVFEQTFMAYMLEPSDGSVPAINTDVRDLEQESLQPASHTQPVASSVRKRA